jgi:hypothetical protein
MVFTNVPVDMAVEGAEASLLKLDRHQKAYEIKTIQVQTDGLCGDLG